MGGFGNVLFQILVFKILSKRNKNISYITKLTEKNFMTKVLGWTIHQNLYSDLIEDKHLNKINNFKSFIIVFLSFLSKIFKFKFKLATFYNPSIQIINNTPNNLFGYFQDKPFLENHKNELLELGCLLKYNYRTDEIMPIVVHYRRGDSHWAVSFAYYYDEIKKMLKKESSPILIVTDSVKDANIFFNDLNNIKIIRSDNALDDFKHLISTEKLYCAPSTFSWWAAHSLDEYSEIIMPKFLLINLGFHLKCNQITFV